MSIFYFLLKMKKNQKYSTKTYFVAQKTNHTFEFFIQRTSKTRINHSLKMNFFQNVSSKMKFIEIVSRVARIFLII